ncbi:hypothetical protein [Lysinibacter cavernae]|uniref:Uncharacterized protein n=1 Tax=Lysinibacter cavernae TaxID=1640652 RepID=A0A7X5R1H8_9MICO|nr:hypothetical protein [Lysinibacter cavernae]NIH53984.1 hypothetical protein [Lysinibacter cavernae]
MTREWKRVINQYKRSSRRPVGLIAVVFTVVLTISSCGLPPDNEEPVRFSEEEQALADYVTEVFEYLDEGKAEQAAELLGLDSGRAACPMLLTDEIYKTVDNRPTNFELSEVIHAKELKEGYATKVTYTLGKTGKQVSETYTFGRNDDGDFSIGTMEFFGFYPTLAKPETRAPGEITVQGQCSDVLSYPDRKSGQDRVFAFPGTYDIAYTDPTGIAETDSKRASIGSYQEMVDVELAAEILESTVKEASALLDQRADNCLTNALVYPDCPPELSDRYGVVENARLSGTFEAEIYELGADWRVQTVGKVPTLETQIQGGLKQTSKYFQGGILTRGVDGQLQLDASQADPR